MAADFVAVEALPGVEGLGLETVEPVVPRIERRRHRRGGRRTMRGRIGTGAHEVSPLWEVLPGVDGIYPTAGAEIGKRRDAGLRRALALADVVATSFALLAVVVLGGPALQLRWTDLLVAPGVVIACKAIGLYDRDQHRLRKGTLDEVPLILTLALVFAVGIWLAESVLLTGRIHHEAVMALAVLTFGFVLAGRATARTMTLRLTPPERLLVLGSPGECARAADAVASGGGSATNAEVVSRVELSPAGEGRDCSEVRKVIENVIAAHRVERVVFATDGCDPDHVLDLMRLIKALGVKLSVLPRLMEVVGSGGAVDQLDGVSLIGVRAYGLSRSSAGLKRAMDFAGSLVLLVLFAPLVAVIAAAIKLDSKGPVLFHQPRIGRRGQRFAMVKFRSMVPDAEARKAELRTQNEAVGGLFKMAEDPRITRVGRFLRRTSLDELPQLLNVVRGEMSLVGPRPLVPDEDALIDGWQRRRLAVKPGMTGMWQIGGSSRIPLPEMVKLDYLYGANWSLWLDLQILLRTIPYVFGARSM